MKVPLRTNKLVALSLAAAFVALAASFALAFPGKSDLAAALTSGAPPEDPNFAPAVQAPPSGEGERGEADEHEEYEEQERREHEERQDD